MEYERKPDRSKLHPYVAEISEMRAMEWSYRDIVKELESNMRLKVSYTNLKYFCERRGITKGVTPRVTPEGKQQSPPEEPSSKPEAPNDKEPSDAELEELLFSEDTPEKNPFLQNLTQSKRC